MVNVPCPVWFILYNSTANDQCCQRKCMISKTCRKDPTRTSGDLEERLPFCRTYENITEYKYTVQATHVCHNRLLGAPFRRYRTHRHQAPCRFPSGCTSWGTWPTLFAEPEEKAANALETAPGHLTSRYKADASFGKESFRRSWRRYHQEQAVYGSDLITPREKYFR